MNIRVCTAILLTCLGTCRSFFELFKKNSALLKQANQLLTRTESAEAKLAEKQECSAKLRTCHLAALAALKEQIDSLMEENAKILTSLKGNPCF